MSNTPKKRAAKKAVAPTPDRTAADVIYRLPPVEAMPFTDLFRIKAATGVDVLDPPSKGHAIVACLWFVSQDTDAPLTFEEAQRLSLDRVEFVDPDVLLPEDHDEDEDPTRGSETRSNEPSSPSSSESPSGTS